VSHLNIGQSVHANELVPPQGVRVLLDAKETLASVVAPHVEKVEEAAVAAVPAEGAAAAPAEGAAAAPAAAGGEKAAAAPAKKEDKKGK
jgi:large subunit ribosomal protein L25